MFLFTLLFLILIVLLFYSFFLAMNLSITKSSPSVSQAQLSPGELSSQSKLPFYHHQSPSCLLRIASTAQETTARVSGPWIRNNLLLRCAAGVTTGTARGCHHPRGHEGRSLTGPVTLGTFSSPCFCCGSALGSPATLFLCAGHSFAHCREGYDLLEIQEGTCKVKVPWVSNQICKLAPM